MKGSHGVCEARNKTDAELVRLIRENSGEPSVPIRQLRGLGSAGEGLREGGERFPCELGPLRGKRIVRY